VTNAYSFNEIAHIYVLFTFGTLPAQGACKDYDVALVCHESEYQEGNMSSLLRRLWQEEEGQDLVEYGLLIFLIALTAVASMGKLANGISAIFTSAATSLTSTS